MLYPCISKTLSVLESVKYIMLILESTWDSVSEFTILCKSQSFVSELLTRACLRMKEILLILV